MTIIFVFRKKGFNYCNCSVIFRFTWKQHFPYLFIATICATCLELGGGISEAGGERVTRNNKRAIKRFCVCGTITRNPLIYPLAALH